MNKIERQYIGEEISLQKAATQLFPEISYNSLMKCFRNKDVKINKKPSSPKAIVKNNDVITIFVPDEQLREVDIIYQDKNIVVVNKQQGLASVGEGSLETLLSEKLKTTIYPVHRLDTNTSGLIIYALNQEVQNCLVKYIKDRKIQKDYLVKVFGKPEKDHALLSDYITKDADKGVVKISHTKTANSQSCITEYSLVSTDENTSILRVTLHTGRTHQIRAHLAYYKMYVVGDEKYGNYTLNKQFDMFKQCLVSYYIKINIPQDDNILGYLSGVEFYNLDNPLV